MSVELTGFQLASTALTVTLNERAGGLRGRGARLARRGARGGGLAREQDLELRERAAVDVVAGLVFAVIVPFVLSVAVNVAEPAVFGVTEKRLRAGDERGVGAGGVAFAVARDEPDGVGGVDGVPVRVDRVDGDVERAAGGLRGRRAGLAGGGAGCGGLAGHQDLQLRERAGVDRRGRARVRGHRAVRDVGRGEGLRAGRLRRDRERLGAGDERGVRGQRRVGVGGGDADGVGGADDVPVRVDRVDGDVEGRPAVWAEGRRSCRSRCPGRRSRPASGSAAC